MNVIYNWALEWGISLAAIADLQGRMGADPAELPQPDDLSTEGGVQNTTRLEAAEQSGALLWRNNVGACVDERGNRIRYGLANESKKQNLAFKSSDLIGIQPRPITPAMVGQVIGQFVARECKRPGWKYAGTPRERAQLAYIERVNALGGDAKFTNRGWD